jgi:hypothetical protein
LRSDGSSHDFLTIRAQSHIILLTVRVHFGLCCAPSLSHSAVARGIEDLFKVFRRVEKHGTENNKVCLERLLSIAAQAGLDCFPAVAQSSVTPDDVEAGWGRGGLSDVRSVLPRLDQKGMALTSSCFHPAATKTDVPKPQVGQASCSAAAHSQQVALEECLLAAPVRSDGTFENYSAMERSWICSLVPTVGRNVSELVHRSVCSCMLPDF